MKSRVINTKYLHWDLKNKKIIGYISELKPSLFKYNDHFREGHLWLQSYSTNKMTRWVLSEWQEQDYRTVDYWVYKPEMKWVAKFPELDGFQTIIYFDTNNWWHKKPKYMIAQDKKRERDKQQRIGRKLWRVEKARLESEGLPEEEVVMRMQLWTQSRKPLSKA